MALLKLLGLCLSMFLGAFVCGEIPLRCSMNQRSMKYITTVGVGLLIGVSFIVIIPEGVHTYYGAKPTAAVRAGSFSGNTTAETIMHEHEHSGHGHDHSGAATPSPVYSEDDATVTQARRTLKAAQHEHDHDHSAHSHDAGAESAHDHSAAETGAESGSAHGHAHASEECVDLNRSPTAVGAALILGFVTMFLVDRIGGAEGHEHGHGGGAGAAGGGHAPGHQHAHSPVTSHIHIHPTAAIPSSAANNEHARDGGQSSSASPNSEGSSSMGRSASHQHLRITPPTPNTPHMMPAALPAVHFDQTATIGILVHSAIDGLALGAIAVSDNSSLELVVFFAIILHKAPAAFGLTSFLLHQGRERGEVRKHLLYFSMAAPVTSLATFVAFSYYNALAGASRLSASSPDGQALLGLCLLFSAGTFLFTIAVHILPEIQSSPAEARSAGEHGGAVREGTQMRMLVCLVFGILAPLLFSSHNHGH